MSHIPSRSDSGAPCDARALSQRSYRPGSISEAVAGERLPVTK